MYVWIISSFWSLRIVLPWTFLHMPLEISFEHKSSHIFKDLSLSSAFMCLQLAVLPAPSGMYRWGYGVKMSTCQGSWVCCRASLSTEKITRLQNALTLGNQVSADETKVLHVGGLAKITIFFLSCSDPKLLTGLIITPFEQLQLQSPCGSLFLDMGVLFTTVSTMCSMTDTIFVSVPDGVQTHDLVPSHRTNFPSGSIW